MKKNTKKKQSTSHPPLPKNWNKVIKRFDSKLGRVIKIWDVNVNGLPAVILQLNGIQLDINFPKTPPIFIAMNRDGCFIPHDGERLSMVFPFK